MRSPRWPRKTYGCSWSDSTRTGTSKRLPRNRKFPKRISTSYSRIWRKAGWWLRLTCIRGALCCRWSAIRTSSGFSRISKPTFRNTRRWFGPTGRNSNLQWPRLRGRREFRSHSCCIRSSWGESCSAGWMTRSSRTSESWFRRRVVSAASDTMDGLWRANRNLPVCSNASSGNPPATRLSPSARCCLSFEWVWIASAWTTAWFLKKPKHGASAALWRSWRRRSSFLISKRTAQPSWMRWTGLMRDVTSAAPKSSRGTTTSSPTV